MLTYNFNLQYEKKSLIKAGQQSTNKSKRTTASHLKPMNNKKDYDI